MLVGSTPVKGQLMERTRRRRRGERAQSMVEFALTLPLILLAVIGLVEVAHGINTYLTVVAASRDAARLGAQGAATDDALKALVTKETERLEAGIPTACSASGAGMCITHPTVSSSDAVKVKVCYNHSLIVGMPGLLPDPLLICSSTTMREAT